MCKTYIVIFIILYNNQSDVATFKSYVYLNNTMTYFMLYIIIQVNITVRSFAREAIPWFDLVPPLISGAEISGQPWAHCL